MTNDYRNALRQYASRADAQAAGRNLGNPSQLQELDYAEPVLPPKSRVSFGRIAAASIALAIVVTAAYGISRPRSSEITQAGQAVPAGQAAPGTTNPLSGRALTQDDAYKLMTPAQRAEDQKASADYAKLVASGWRPWAVQPVFPEDNVATQAYEPLLPEFLTQVPPSRDLPRIPLFDAPNGHLIGYEYPNAGFVTAARADSPTFDSASLYHARGLCAPNQDPATCPATGR